MKTTYDKEIDAMYIYLKKTKIFKTVPVTQDIIIDLDKEGGIVGIEVLDASKHVPEELIKSSIKLTDSPKTVTV